MISIDWGTKVIFIPRDDLTLVQSTPTVIYNMDLNWFRLQLKNLEDNEEGMCFPTTHNHNTEVSLGGLTFARVIEIINDYTITFEDGQYAVNLVGANSNIADRVNVNQVSVRSANSAGLTSSPTIEYASFNGGVTINTLSSAIGTIYPIGTPLKPASNFNDASLIAHYRGFAKYYVIGDLTLQSGNDISFFTFVGEDVESTTLTLSSGINTIGTKMYSLTLTGVCGGRLQLFDCDMLDIEGLCATGGDGIYSNCEIEGTIQLRSTANKTFIFKNCYGIKNSQYPIIDVNGCPAGIQFDNYTGALIFKNITNPISIININLDSGYVILDSSVTSGTIVISGIGILEDNSAGATVDISSLLNTNLAAASSGLTTEERNKLFSLPEDAGLTIEEHAILIGLSDTISGSGGGLTTEDRDRLWSIPTDTLTIEEHDKLLSLTNTISGVGGLTQEEHDKLFRLPEDTISGSGLTIEDRDRLWSLPLDTLTSEEHYRLFSLPDTISGAGLTIEEHERLWSLPTSAGLTVDEHNKLLRLPEISDIGTVVTDTINEEIGPTLLRMLGLLQENQYLDQTTYTVFNGQKLLLSGRIRTYSNAASVGTSNNVIATYQITTSWSGDEMQSYKVIKV